ncbi:MAG: hypothetical protein H7293_04120 [Candidatus Saccharibacteria bacterium]|nr:hypothetical protein [Rhodoferax sp.]
MTLKIGNTTAAINRIRQADLERRRGATTILTPTAVQGTTSPAKVLYTTLGGQARPITPADLAAFRKRIAEVGKDLRQGITASEAIGLSRPIDLERARKEIRYAAPTVLRAGELQFVVDSGPQSLVSRHHTRVEFTAWAAAIARPSTPLQAAAWLVSEGTLRFECSCDAFTFWGFRYIATVGGFVLGRRETGFPKIRSPKLLGCCCKHLVRTLTTLKSDLTVRRRIAAGIDAERRRLDGTRRTTPVTIRATQAEANKITSAPVRRITAFTPAQRGQKLPPMLKSNEIKRALAALANRPDISAQAIAQALQHLLKQAPKGARP